MSKSNGQGITIDDARAAFTAARGALNEAIQNGNAKDRASRVVALRAAEAKLNEMLAPDRMARINATVSRDFTDVSPLLNADLSIKANVYAETALASIIADKETPSKQTLIAALRAMCTIVADVLPTHAAQLAKPVTILIRELAEANAGRKDGKFIFLEHSRTWDSRIASIEEIERQGAAVLAFQWLQLIGLSPGDAAGLLDTDLEVGRERIIEWERYFKKKRPKNRRPIVLHNLWVELQEEWCWGDGAPRSVDSATSHEIMEWVKQRKDNGTIVTKTTAKARRKQDHTRD